MRLSTACLACHLSFRNGDVRAVANPTTAHPVTRRLLADTLEGGLSADKVLVPCSGIVLIINNNTEAATQPQSQTEGIRLTELFNLFVAVSTSNKR